MENTPGITSLEAELAGVEKNFSLLKSTAESCCTSIRRANELAVKLETGSISDPTLKKRAESLHKSTLELKGYEEALNKQIESTRRPLRSLEVLRLQQSNVQ